MMVQIKINNLPLNVPDNQDVLKSVLDLGYTVNHSCRNGRCRECLVKISRQGSSIEHLACQYVPSEKDTIYFDRLEEVRLPEPIVSAAKVNNITKLSTDYLLVEFRFPPNRSFKFLPGQYIDIVIPNVGVRSYSIYSSEYIESKLTILVGKVQNGAASKFFFSDVREDVLVTIKGPFGSFFYRNNKAKNIIFCATGSGISPIRSILLSRSFCENINPETKIFLLWSMKEEDHFFETEIASVLDNSFNFKKFVTRGKSSNFNSGRLNTPVGNIIEKASTCEILDLYACGHPNLIKDLKNKIQEVKCESIQIFSDPFTYSWTV